MRCSNCGATTTPGNRWARDGWRVDRSLPAGGEFPKYCLWCHRQYNLGGTPYQPARLNSIGMAERRSFWHGVPVAFDTREEIVPGGYTGEYGIVHPGGNIYLETVLSDGSIGWGESWQKSRLISSLLWEDWRGGKS